MDERAIDINTPDGIADCVLFRPGDGTYPGIIDLPDIGGWREATLDASRRLAEQGFVVLAVNPFYRTIRSPFWSPGQDKMGRMAELVAPLTPEAVERDAAALVGFLATQPGVTPGRVGVLGHCFTGGLALRYAAAMPDRVAAAASFHGGFLRTDAPTSTHLLLPRVKARMYLGHASNDRSMPAESIAALEGELRQQGKRFESETYPAAHGWTVSDGASFNAEQAERAFGKLVSLMKEELG